jgi:hypothetical protein
MDMGQKQTVNLAAYDTALALKVKRSQWSNKFDPAGGFRCQTGRMNSILQVDSGAALVE